MATPPLQLEVGMPAPGYVPGYTPKETPESKTGSSEEKKEIDRLRSTNELWKTFAPEWDLYLAAYEGGTDMANEKYLFKHQRENDEDFLDRVKRAHYPNYCNVIIDFFTNFIFQETIQRSGGTNDAWYQAFVTDVDRRGSTIDDYMKATCDDMQIYGMAYHLVEAPPAPTQAEGQVLTKQDEQDLNIRPYWVSIRPEEVIDWVADDFDVFSYLKRKQVTQRMDVAIDGKKIIVERYTEWFTDKIWISEIDVTDSMNPKLLGRQTLDNSMGEIPVYVTRYHRSKRWNFMAISFLRDFAYNNREIMNITSLLDEFLYRQCFNMLAKEADTTIPTFSQEDGVVGTANVLEYPKGAEVPKYISPPVDPAKFLQEERDWNKREMFRRAAQDTLNELFNGEKASGFSQAQSFSKTVPFIATRADTLEKTEIALMQLTMKRIGKTWDGKIKYKDRYEITNLTDAITQLVQLGRDLFILSPTFIKEEMKRLVQEYDGKFPADTLKKILGEIDAMDFDEWSEVQKEALVGLPKVPATGKSPSAQQKPKSTGTMREAAQEAKTNKVGATSKTQ